MAFDPLHWLASALERLPTCPNSQIDSYLAGIAPSDFEQAARALMA